MFFSQKSRANSILFLSLQLLINCITIGCAGSAIKGCSPAREIGQRSVSATTIVFMEILCGHRLDDQAC